MAEDNEIFTYMLFLIFLGGGQLYLQLINPCVLVCLFVCFVIDAPCLQFFYILDINSICCLTGEIIFLFYKLSLYSSVCFFSCTEAFIFYIISLVSSWDYALCG